MIIEGHAYGTGASLWGDIPYSEAGNSEIEDPVLIHKFKFMHRP